MELGAQLSFMEADILKLGAEKAEAWFKAEPRLAAYRISFERTLRQKDHILPEAQARIARAYSAGSHPGLRKSSCTEVTPARSDCTAVSMVRR